MNLLRRFVLYRTVPILMYHQIATTTPEEDPFRLAVPPKRFETQMRYLSDHGFKTATLNEVISWVENGENPPGSRIVITFDDGYLDNYTNAFPVLQKYGFSVTIFLVSDFLGKSRSWGHGHPACLMDWGHAREMSRFGVSFNAHTCTHPDLTTLSNQEASRELIESRKKIEDALGVAVRHFAYPWGRYDKRIMQLTEDAGYEAAFAIRKSEMSRYCMERFEIALRDGGSLFRLKTSAWASWIRTVWNLWP